MSSYPQQLAFSGALKPAGVKAKMNRTEFYPLSAGTFSPSSARVCTIPISSNAFMDTTRSWLNFTVSATVATANAYLRSGYSMFSRLRILNQGGQVLEDLMDYGLLVNKYIDLLVDPATRGGQLSSCGFGDAQVGLNSTILNALEFDNLQTFTAGATTSFTVQLPLALSGIMNMTSSRHGESGQGLYLPLCLAQGGLYLELTLRDNAYDMLEGTATTSITALNISNVRFSAMMLDFGAEVVANLKQAILAQGGRAFISTESYNVQTLSSASTVRSFNLAFKARSVKGIAWINRLATQNGSPVNSYDASVYYAPTNTYILASGMRIPAQPIETYAEFVANLQDYFGKPLKGAFAARQVYTSDAIAFADATIQGSAMFGVDLESVRDYLESGMDAQGNVSFVLNQTTTSSASTITTVITHFDQVLICDVVSGQWSVSY